MLRYTHPIRLHPSASGAGPAEARQDELDPEHPDWTSSREDVFVRRHAGRFRVGLVDPLSDIPSGSLHLFDRHAVMLYEISRRLARNHEVVAYPRRAFGEPRIGYSEDVTYHRISDRLDRLRNRLSRFSRSQRHSSGPSGTPTLPDFSCYAQSVARDLRQRRCEIVHLFGMVDLIPAIRQLNPQAQIVLHMCDRSLIQRDVARIGPYLAEAALILGCSHSVTDEICGHFPACAPRCHTLHSGVSRRFLRIPSRPEQSQTVLSVGRLSAEKGTHVLLQAFARVGRTHPQADLHVVGRFELPWDLILDSLSPDSLLQRYAEFFDRPSSFQDAVGRSAQFFGSAVRLDDPIPNTEIESCYLRAGVFVYPSLWQEPFGIPVVEAMAAGLPVVATHSGALSEIVVDGETGFLVARGSIEGLVSAITRLLDNPALRAKMGAAGRARVSRLFTWGGSVSRLCELCERLMAERGVP